MKVEIPVAVNHYDYFPSTMTVEISDSCPKCGGKRGVKRGRGFSYDGRHRVAVDTWENECGHIDLYRDVIKEVKDKSM